MWMKPKQKLNDNSANVLLSLFKSLSNTEKKKNKNNLL